MCAVSIVVIYMYAYVYVCAYTHAFTHTRTHAQIRSGEGWDKIEAIRAVLLGVLVQAAANVNNTYWDFVNGVDTPTVIPLCTYSSMYVFSHTYVHVCMYIYIYI